jgi:hypothetical protein
MAWYIEKALACPMCGTRKDEWDPQQGGHLHAFEAKSWICHGCRITQEVTSTAHKDNPDLHGIKVRLQPTKFHPSYKAGVEKVGR